MFEEKARVNRPSELQGATGVEENFKSITPSREPAKVHLRRIIERLRRESEEAHFKAIQLQALFNELPEQLSPQADTALEELLNLRPKQY